ncbi:hypothetical protein NNJEOMEG_00780 [Fundidesulfovibrio magnetotacticus]|uniref:DUF2917 domain-containing protein n=1 Tax=Fundidesulfovibrio magnetotacticus TaxID=2730080 RepID=A0A6V8LJP2_9BACT|nr:DUF2917 domain-containing protein [Fundidesulfovibrio magnetotacticus]GFK92952.1 hypothetical protein NNJEOMEG_00780 [Fundidesulfovibrio magnetotacticus]
MAYESTPRNWPCESRGLADDARDALFPNAFSAFVQRLLFALTPRGRAVVTLAPGQTAVLEGQRLARVACLEGQAWVTNPDIGRDVLLKGGEIVESQGGASMAVTAVRGPSRVSLGWK